MSKLIYDKDGNITLMRVTNARASYAYLTSPRPEGSLKAGSYGVELQIPVEDTETIKLLKEYIKAVAKAALPSVWNNKQPKNIGVPYKLGDEEKESEKGMFIIKTTSGFQPKLYIRKPGKKTVELTAENHEEFYSGMIVDADIRLKPYNVSSNQGITAYIQAVCKVGDGTPFVSPTYGAASFDLDDEEYDDEEESSAASFDLDDALFTKPTTKSTTKPTTKPKQDEPEEPVLTLDDLLNA